MRERRMLLLYRFYNNGEGVIRRDYINAWAEEKLPERTFEYESPIRSCIFPSTRVRFFCSEMKLKLVLRRFSSSLCRFPFPSIQIPMLSSDSSWTLNPFAGVDSKFPRCFASRPFGNELFMANGQWGESARNRSSTPRKAELISDYFLCCLLLSRSAAKSARGAFTKIKNETKSGKFTFFVPNRSWGAFPINEGCEIILSSSSALMFFCRKLKQFSLLLSHKRMFSDCDDYIHATLALDVVAHFTVRALMM